MTMCSRYRGMQQHSLLIYRKVPLGQVCGNLFQRPYRGQKYIT